MITEFTFLIGVIAGVCTSLAYLPQVIKTWKTRQTNDISLALLILLNVGTLFWIIYGILLGDMIIIFVNVIVLLLAGSVLSFKLKYG